MVLKFLAVALAGVFAGAALYVSLVEHPARMSTGTAPALREFGPSYHRGAWMQASLAILGSLAALLDYSQEHERGYLWGGLLLAAPVVYTLVVILPTNRRLLAPDLPADGPEAAALLRRWGHLHWVRTGLGMAAFGLLLRSILT